MKKIVIIGAGPTGLTAAWQLAHVGKEPYEIVILEASEDIGGMAKTVVHNGNRLDIGGHRFFSKEKEVLEWWNMVMSEAEDSMPSLLLRDRNVSVYYQQTSFVYPIQMNYENIKKLGIKTSLHILADYLWTCVKPLKEISLEQFYINRFGKKLYSMFFKDYTCKLCGVNPDQISPAWGKQRVRGLSIRNMLLQQIRRWKKPQEGLLSENSFYYPMYGPGQLWEKVAQQIEGKGAILRKSTPVVGIYQNQNKKMEYLIVKTPTGEERVDGDVFISTMPMRELISIMNEVPQEVSAVAKELPYRGFVTVGLLVDKLAIKKKENWIYVHDSSVKVGRVQFYDNWSPFLKNQESGYAYIAMEYFCDEGDDFWNMSDEECLALAVEEAGKLGIVQMDVKVLDWHREKIGQAYPGYYGAYQDIDVVRNYLEERENLFCIGRNGQHEYWNMDKCMMSAWEIVEKL